LLNIFGCKEFTDCQSGSSKRIYCITKNENNILPYQKILSMVTGPTANMLSVLNGGWTITWQGNEETLYPQEKNTMLEAIQNRLAKTM